MFLSQTCNHGIRAALFLATVPPDTFVPVREVSERIGVSSHFLTKILQILTARNIMQSFRGPSGGVKLARSANAIRLIDIVDAIDGLDIFKECILGLEGCGDEAPCPVHEQWGPLREQIKQVFEATTLEKLAADFSRGGLRLSNLGSDQATKPGGKS
jgi:Rrf2 family protein